MITLPGDEQGRFWVEAEWSENPVQEKKILATLVTIDEDDHLLILGTAFVIRDNGDSAICLGAAHSFEKVKNLQRMRTAKAHLNVPPDFQVIGTEFIEPGQMGASFVIDGEAIVCRIDQLNYIQNYDVVVFSVFAPESRKIFTSRIAIDLSAPRVGEEIAILANDITVKNKSIGKAHIEQRFDLRLGVVTEVVMDRSPLPGLSFFFRTTIPTTGGMSGAPVVNKPIPGQEMVVRGVVSSDNSEEEAFKNFLISGDSAMSMLWPAMGFGLNVETPDSAMRHMFLADLLHKKLLDDRSDGVKIQVRQPDDKTEILYIDERTNPPTTMQLLTTGHPRTFDPPKG